jgi:RNA polymerase sigma-54 factor
MNAIGCDLALAAVGLLDGGVEDELAEPARPCTRRSDHPDVGAAKCRRWYHHASIRSSTATPPSSTPPDDTLPEPAAPEQATDKSDGETDLVLEGDNAADFERLDNLVTEYDWIEDEGEYRGTRSRERLAEEGDAKLDAMANTAARAASLQEFLLEQWRLANVDDITRRYGERLINELDDSGRLSTPLADLVDEFDPPANVDDLEYALHAVQELEPPGIGARDVAECLILQLEAQRGDNSLEIAIVTDHLDDLRRNRLPQIAKALDVSLEDVKGALEVISGLSLHPADQVVDRQVPSITPDVIVEYDEEDDDYSVRLTRPNTRELRISPDFRRALQQAGKDKAARNFVRQKIEQANAIIDALRFRRDRLLDVAKAVVAAQREFLEHGEQHIKVLRMSELAERFSCDPSTISRTVDEKYMQTPRGLYPLRRFFTGGSETDAGESVSWDAIRAKVQEIIAQEDKSKPLSDDAIVTELKQQGIDLKRRTVAKYRSQLNIPTARQRREY